MKGTDKQIEYAKSIKENFSKQFEAIRNDPKTSDVAKKAIDYIEKIPYAAFWIEKKDRDPKAIIMDLFSGGLKVAGIQYANTAKMDKTGQISESWKK
jgi:hypothetical protein